MNKAVATENLCWSSIFSVENLLFSLQGVEKTSAGKQKIMGWSIVLCCGFPVNISSHSIDVTQRISIACGCMPQIITTECARDGAILQNIENRVHLLPMSCEKCTVVPCKTNVICSARIAILQKNHIVRFPMGTLQYEWNLFILWGIGLGEKTVLQSMAIEEAVFEAP